MAKVEWDSIQREGKEAFDRFALSLTQLGEKNPRWKVTQVESRNGNRIIAHYFETEEAAQNGTGYQAVDIDASMQRFTSSGHLTMKGNETWEFERSELVGSIVSATLAAALDEAGLAAISKGGREQSGRRSRWTAMWDIYPKNHPRVRRS